MKFKRVTAAVAAAAGAAAVAIIVPVASADTTANPCSFSSSLAKQVLDQPKFNIQANPKGNLFDAAAGLQVDAGNGTKVCLQPNMLKGLNGLAGSFSELTITSFATGVHSPRSHHYVGEAVDIGTVNGAVISDDVPGDGNDTPTAAENALMDQCAALGADEIIGPGQPAHDNHIHCAWQQ